MAPRSCCIAIPPRTVARAAASATSARRFALSPSGPPFTGEFDVGSLVELDVVVTGSVSVIGEPVVMGALTVCGLSKVCGFCRVAGFSEAAPCGLLVSSDTLPPVAVIGELLVIGACTVCGELRLCGFSSDGFGAAAGAPEPNSTTPTEATSCALAFATDEGAEAVGVGSVERPGGEPRFRRGATRSLVAGSG